MFGGNCKCDVKSWLVNGFVIAVLYLGLDMFFHHYCMAKDGGAMPVIWFLDFCLPAFMQRVMKKEKAKWGREFDLDC